MAPKGYADLADLPEDNRIEVIVKAAQGGAMVGFVVDDDAKADRYIKKMAGRVQVYGRAYLAKGPNDPARAGVLVRVGPRAN